jgi:phenylacetate-coenzyme A ligase PaaK-like adenylate-forming protein
MLRLSTKDGSLVEVFADAISRVLLQSLPLDADYRLIQTGASELFLEANLSADQQRNVTHALTRFFEQQGVTAPLTWTYSTKAPDVDFTRKRRRIVRQWQA